MIALACLLVGMLVFGSIVLVRSFDQEALAHEEALVANGMTGNAEEIQSLVAPQVIWGDAVRYIDNRFDPQWASVNILNYLIETARFDEVYIVDSEDRFLIGRSGSLDVRENSMWGFSRSAPDLIPSIRRAERARAEEGGFDKSPIQASAIVSTKGASYILTASRIQPDDIDVWLRGERGPVVLAAIKLDSRFLDRFANRFLLKDLRMTSGHTPPIGGRATTGLNGPNGQPVAWASWAPQKPGARLFNRLLPWIIGLAAIIVILVWRLVIRSQRIAQGLITSEARAAHLAYHDALTGLANRVQFSDRLNKALAQQRRTGKPLAVLCIDLDRFKDINDTYGHAVGDELLKETAIRMAAHCREEDVLARLSGDEFAILLQIESARDAAALAERLCREIAEPFQCGGTQLHIGCSIGATIARKHPVESAEILRQADIALYRAKEEGRGRYSLFERDMDVAIKSRRALEDELRGALAREELELHYQPQVDMLGHITGLEALIRWHHPVRGEISPAFFVPIAEQSGLILDLGVFALRRAFTDSKRWPGLRIAVNISANQLRDRTFIGTLTQLIRECGVDPQNFDLEITEGILLGDDPETQTRLAELNKMGFCLALDDFGTGYSSLSYLHRFPIGKIKIDRSFIANLGVEAEADAVVDAIVKLAKALGLGVIAEGVETAAQFAHLKGSGAIELQGYLFSRACAADAIAIMLDRSLAPAGTATPRKRAA